MFGIDAKEIFLQKIYDVIVILFAIHIIAVTFMYIIKYIQPLLKKLAAENRKQKPKKSSEYSLLFSSWPWNKNNSPFYECEGKITDDEYISTFENLKTFIDIAEDPSKGVFDSSSLMKISMMSDSEFERALSLGNLLRKLSKRKCSSEAQTNISINPAVKLDFSRPELVCQDILERTTRKTDSSDSFLSLSSKNSSADIKKDLEQIINEFESNDDLLKNESDEDVSIKKIQKYLKANIAKSEVANSFRRSGTLVSQDNKLLEKAIAEFEKELKPIKDQIQILKECISGFDLISNNRNSICIPSDFNSSFSESGTFSESLSGTCCSADMQSYFSSYHIISATSFGSLDADSRYKNIKKLDKMASLNSSKNKHKNTGGRINKQFLMKEGSKTQVLDPPERNASSRRSPIAEMYVKLSQCNLQPSCLVKSKKEKIASSDNAVTYRIDLNVNLAGVPVANCQKSKLMKERSIQPLTSDPDEILGKPPNIPKSLKRKID